MGSKGQNSTSQVQIPAQVLQNYTNTYNTAAQVDSQPFQAFTGQAVAPVNAQQQQGIAATNTAAGSYQPYTNAATAYTVAGGQSVDPSQLDVNKYLSPYLSDVVGSESALLNQNNQQQQSGQLGTAIQSGAFGGDRAGIAAANLAGQQNLTNANIYSNLLNQGYNTALSTAQQQQGVDLSAGQANRAATQQTGQTLANLGAQTQGLGLAGAQAQIGAGSLEQQTQQAQDTFNVQQYSQQQSLPYQQIGQLADIAEGIGANSGSTTTTNTTSNGLFSDERLKEDIRPVGETFDGQKIYTYKYRGHPHTHMGLMAQNVEHKHPEAVGLASGYKTVDYKKATDKAADRGHFAAGGSLPYDGTPTVTDMMAGRFQQMYGGLLAPQSGPMVPQHSGATAQLHPAQAGAPAQNPSVMNQAAGAANDAVAINKAGQQFGLWGGQHEKQGTRNAGLKSVVNSGSAPIGQVDASGLGSVQGMSTLNGQNAGMDNTLDQGGADIAPVDSSSLDGIQDTATFADGGSTPYGGDEIDVPQDQQWAQLKPAQAPSGGGSQDNTMNDIKDVAQIAAMFAANGGRIGRADGGSIKDLLYPKLNHPALRSAPAEDVSAAPALPSAEESDNDPIKSIGNAQNNIEGAENAKNSPDSGPADDGIEVPSGLASVISAIKPTKGGKLDSDAVKYLTSNGVPSHVALGVAAGLSAESGNDPSAVNPKSGAFGLEQLLGPRKERFVQKYGQSTSKQDQLENLLWELKGGDRGGSSVLASKSPEEALQNYVTKFMRPKAGYETERDLSSGLGALRHGFASGGRPGFANAGPVGSIFDTSLAVPGVSDPSLDPDWQKRQQLQQTDVPSAQQPDAQPALPSGPLGLASPAEKAASDDSWSEAGPTSPDRMAQPAPDKSASTNFGTDQSDPYDMHGGYFKRLGAGKPDAILSLLSGLSAAATANTRNPLTAAFTGLGAGANAYQAQRQYQLDAGELQAHQLKARAEAVNVGNQVAQGRFSNIGPGQWRDNNTGNIMNDADHAKALGNIPFLSEFTGTPVGQPQGQYFAQNPVLTTPPNASANAAPAPPPKDATEAVLQHVESLPQVSKFRTDMENYRAQAQQRLELAQQYEQSGAKGQAAIFTQKAQQLENLANNAQSQYNTNRTAYSNTQLEAIKGANSANIERNVTTKNQAYNDAIEATQQIQNADAIRSRVVDANGHYLTNGGPLGQTITDWGAMARQFGVPEDVIATLSGNAPQNAQEVGKMQAALASGLARSSLPTGQIRASEWNAFLKNTPGNDLLPAATVWLTDNVIKPQLKNQMGAYEAVRGEDPIGGDAQSKYYDYKKKNPWFHAEAAPAANPAEKSNSQSAAQQPKYVVINGKKYVKNQ